MIANQHNFENAYKIKFMKPIMIHSIELGTVPASYRYKNICFELLGAPSGQESSTKNQPPVRVLRTA